MIVRLMKKEEVDEVRSIIYKALSRKASTEYKNSLSTFVVVADNGIELCGAATVYIHFDELIAQKDYFISNLCVLPEFQRQGIASEIVKYIEEKAKEEDIKYVYTLVPIKHEETSKLYAKLRYEIKNINCFRKEI